MQKGIDSILEEVVDRSLSTPPPEQPLWANFIIFKFIRLVQLRQRLGLYVRQDDPNMPVLLAAFSEGRRVVEGWGGKLIVVFLPSERSLRSKSRVRHYASHEQIAEVAGRAGLDIIDLYGVFANHPDPLSFFSRRSDLHYNAEGNRFVAENMWNNLMQRQLLPMQK